MGTTSNNFCNIDIIDKYVYDTDVDFLIKIKQEITYKNKKTLDKHIDIHNWMINNPKYIDYVKKCLKIEFDFFFKNHVYDISYEVKNCFEGIIKSKKDFTSINVRTFVINNNLFDKIYGEYIKTTHLQIHKYNIDEVDFLHSLEHFKSKIINIQITVDNQITLQRIIEDVVNDLNILDNKNLCNDLKTSHHTNKDHLLSKSFIDSDHIVNTYKSFNNDMEPSVYQINSILNKINDKDFVLQLILSESLDDKLASLYHVEKHFYHVFNRSISIFEAIKYYKDYDNSITYFEKIKCKYDEIVLIARHLYKIYLNIEFDENGFLKTFCKFFDLTDPKAIENIMIDKLLLRPEYEQNMRQIIKTNYKTSYNTDINIHDIQHLFTIIVKSKLHLEDENIHKIMNKIKTETDNFINKINHIFNTILKRDADDDEIILYLSNFRDESIDVKQNEYILTNNLYESLEYHEVLKQIICEILDEHNKPKKPSNIFNCLKLILDTKDNDIKRSKQKITDLIILIV